ncbi:putative ECF subfamily RNA polymerase sigma-24 factor [Magnetofaba australis IT-1]|uniref:Putative ECF subfamily RNA polymerase sigma-24 factor n=2 Tax=Magnetofaba TaxID=1472292 RepID=A0A1Y2K2P6_9PROT|nr:putative ECF subfamily RNA polymerase sigma-24 factor [Magnetofaba australis IT-1]
MDDMALDATRAAFLADAFSQADAPTAQQIHDDMAARRQKLADLKDYDRIVLLFEHDLYDQLQLLQILERLGRREDVAQRCALACIDRFDGIEPFWGLGQLNPTQLAEVMETAQPVTEEPFDVARRVWRAIRQPDPKALARALKWDTEALPFLHAALLRFCQEFPWQSDGLTLTQRRLLEAVANPPAEPRLSRPMEPERYARFVQAVDSFPRIFNAYMYSEPAPFWGDLGVKGVLDDLTCLPEPLLACTQQDAENPMGLETRYALTPRGAAFMTGELTGRAVAQQVMDRGGVRISPENPWFWDDEKQTFCV